MESISPPAKLLLALGKEQADKALEGLAQAGIRYVALILVELAGGEQAARRHQRLVQLIDDSGLADAGIAGHQHEFRCAGRDNPVEGREQRVDLALAAVELLRNQQPVRYVAVAEREGFDPAMRLPLRKTDPQIGLDASGGLVALLGGLGEKLHHDCRERPRDIYNPLMRRHRLPRDMAVYPPHRIVGREWEVPRQHFVES